jgi:hypothetical protein
VRNYYSSLLNVKKRKRGDKMKLVIDLKSLVVGLILGTIIVFAIAATGMGDYQCALSSQGGSYLYAVLDVRTGKTQLTNINTGAGHLVIKTTTLDSSGKGEWP